jgi:predicted RNA-binding Zn-ribbon protein involved in translation (DUF1610 family)
MPDEKGQMPTVPSYTPEQLNQFRATFKPQADRYIRCSNLLFPSAFFLLGGAVLLEPCSGWTKIIPITALAVGMTLFLLLMFTPIPRCPACHVRLSSTVNAYCPACGSAAITKMPTRSRPYQYRCEGCNKIWRGSSKGQDPEIRACTHCGVVLLKNDAL